MPPNVVFIILFAHRFPQNQWNMEFIKKMMKLCFKDLMF